MMGSSSEFFADRNASTRRRDPTGRSGEDVYLPKDTRQASATWPIPPRTTPLTTTPSATPGIRTTAASTPVGIPNHAYYLLVNGGSNAGEVRGHITPGRGWSIGLTRAEQIF